MTIALIFALLFFAFGSPVEAGLVMMNVPFSLVGGFLLLWIRGINLSVSAAVATARQAVLRAVGDDSASVEDAYAGAEVADPQRGVRQSE